MSMAGENSTGPGEPAGFRRIWRVLRQLFHEMIGASFAVLAVGWINLAFRAWTGHVPLWLVCASLCVVAVFVAFAISAFRRARQL